MPVNYPQILTLCQQAFIAFIYSSLFTLKLFTLKPFFSPRLGSHYKEGWDGLRTMVVGVHLLCEEDCPHKALCTSPVGVVQMDNRCPCYAPHRQGANADYYRLGNCNAIELETYIYKDGKSPAFSSFTKYLLKERDNVTFERREELWAHLGFYNFMQCFRPDSATPSYAAAPELYDSALPAFRQLLTVYQPQLLYVWGSELVAYLRQAEVAGLEYVRETDMQAMTVHLFSYNFHPYSNVSAAQLQTSIASSLQGDLAIDEEKSQRLYLYIRHALREGFITCDGKCLSVRSSKKKSVAYLSHMLCLSLNMQWQHFDALFGIGTHTSLRHAHYADAPIADREKIDAWVNEEIR